MTKKRRWQRTGYPVLADRVFFHCLKQGALGFRHRAINFIREWNLAKYWARMELEILLTLPIYRTPSNIARQNINGKLNPPVLQTKHSAQGARESGLSSARHIFNQKVSTSQQARQRQPHFSLLTQDNGIEPL